MTGRAETSQHASLPVTYFSSSPWLQQSYSKRCGTSSRPWLGESPATFLADLVWEELRILGIPWVCPLQEPNLLPQSLLHEVLEGKPSGQGKGCPEGSEEPY